MWSNQFPPCSHKTAAFKEVLRTRSSAKMKWDDAMFPCVCMCGWIFLPIHAFFFNNINKVSLRDRFGSGKFHMHGLKTMKWIVQTTCITYFVYVHACATNHWSKQIFHINKDLYKQKGNPVFKNHHYFAIKCPQEQFNKKWPLEMLRTLW